MWHSARCRETHLIVCRAAADMLDTTILGRRASIREKTDRISGNLARPRPNNVRFPPRPLLPHHAARTLHSTAEVSSFHSGRVPVPQRVARHACFIAGSLVTRRRRPTPCRCSLLLTCTAGRLCWESSQTAFAISLARCARARPKTPRSNVRLSAPSSTRSVPKSFRLPRASHCSVTPMFVLRPRPYRL